MTNGGQMVRTFVFETDEDVRRFMAFMKANRQPMAEQKRYLQAVISEYKETRTSAQNRFMWKGLLEPASEQAWTNGRRLSEEGWNKVLKIMFLPETCAKGVDKWFIAPDGSRTLEMSTSDLNVEEMRLYLDQCSAFLTTDMGVHLPINPRDL